MHIGGDLYKVQSDFATIANGGNSVPYSPIELYLAGLIPPDEVPDLWVAEDGEWLIENGEFVLSDDERPIFTATNIKTITIEDIIAEHGERIPDWTMSQKDFQAAAVLLVDDDHPATPSQIQEVSDHVSWFSHPGNNNSFLYNYYEATGVEASSPWMVCHSFSYPIDRRGGVLPLVERRAVVGGWSTKRVRVAAVMRRGR